jgi:hypothetical protein
MFSNKIEKENKKNHETSFFSLKKSMFSNKIEKENKKKTI